MPISAAEGIAPLRLPVVRVELLPFGIEAVGIPSYDDVFRGRHLSVGIIRATDSFVVFGQFSGLVQAPNSTKDLIEFTTIFNHQYPVFHVLTSYPSVRGLPSCISSVRFVKTTGKGF